MKLLGPDFRTFLPRDGKPDLFFSNQSAFLNYAIFPGQLTSSDHLPLIIRLSTKPIVNPSKRNFKFNNADLELFKNRLEEKFDNEVRLHDLNGRDDIDAAVIEENLLRWIEIIKDTRDDVIPKGKISYFLHARESDYLRILEDTYKVIWHKPVWSRHDLEIIRELQRRIKDENLRLSKEAWERTVHHLNDIYKDSAKFWGKVRQLIGTDKVKNEYLIDVNNQNTKVFKDDEKEILYRNIWTKIFEIPPEDNRHFDGANEARVREFLTLNRVHVLPYQFADLSRLDEGNILTRPIRNADVLTIIKNFKNKAPGFSGINKLILSNLPNNAIDRYSHLSNLTLSMGYYPTAYKNGIIVFAPKSGKDPKLPENYRPITLLEVPGKLLEQIINDRFIHFCENNTILSQQQFGFRKRRGTETAIAIAYEKIALNQQQKNYCNVICRDVAKAFD